MAQTQIFSYIKSGRSLMVVFFDLAHQEWIVASPLNGDSKFAENNQEDQIEIDHSQFSIIPQGLSWFCR